MPTSYSVEGRIEATLRALNCSGRAFVNIAWARGIKVSNSTFALAMSKETESFDNQLGSSLLEVAHLMQNAQKLFSDVPINWNESEKIALLLSLVVMKQIAAEDGHLQLERDVEAALNHEVK